MDAIIPKPIVQSTPKGKIHELEIGNSYSVHHNTLNTPQTTDIGLSDHYRQNYEMYKNDEMDMSFDNKIDVYKDSANYTPDDCMQVSPSPIQYRCRSNDQKYIKRDANSTGNSSGSSHTMSSPSGNGSVMLSAESSP